MNKIKDPVSGFTHLAGAIASAIGLIFLIAKAKETIDIVSVTIFGVSLILLYSASAIYHLLNVSEKTTKLLRKLDHIMIYVLIAGTYTPICLGPLIGGWGWSIFGVIWGLTILRIVLNYILVKCTKMAYNWNLFINGMDCNNSNLSNNYDIQII